MIKLIQITKKAEEVTKNFEKVKTVFLVEEADMSTFSLLFSLLDVNSRTTRIVLTKIEKAIEWLLREDAASKSLF
jgi:hypothetical protein